MSHWLRDYFTSHIKNVKREKRKRIKTCKAFWMRFNEFYQLFCLGVGMAVYLLLGAAVFTAIEGGAEQMRIDAVVENQARLIDNLTETFNASRSEVVRILNEFQDSCQRGLLLTKTVRMWEFGSALFFAITVVTTIGYGNIAPSTESGKIFCVFYALIGIPLCLILLALIGKIILWIMKFAFAFFSRKPVSARFVGLLALGTLGLTFFALIPAAIISVVEEWDYSLSLYYTFVSCSTIGFGDLVAGQQDDIPSSSVLRSIYKVGVGVWLFLGLATLAIILSLIADAMKLIWKRLHFGATKAHKRIVGLSSEKKGTSNVEDPMVDSNSESETPSSSDEEDGSDLQQVAADDKGQSDLKHYRRTDGLKEKPLEMSVEGVTPSLDIEPIIVQAVVKIEPEAV